MQAMPSHRYTLPPTPAMSRSAAPKGVSQNASDADSTTSESMRGDKMRSAVRTDLRRHHALGIAAARPGTRCPAGTIINDFN
jgi:hypothetical protein